ncbi:hypothetical protein SAMN05421503_2261 [Terribacillus aidingensis]|uniref:Uncharacterized protein n=1 Tax=Terribacillus aidingensis TaxID=586416 RepID=A0A285NXN2_9BACI|nr:hypothetical protein [Terribacillus aidingensis]SNZ14199.1 hypothetical protein SAMN05421503_2261 [Terribacillus aidingensis]
MTIKVTRQKNYYGGLARIKLYAVDRMLTKLKNGETYEFKPDSKLVNIRTTVQGGGYSNKVEVNDDSSVTIKVNPFSKTLYFIGVIGIILAWLFKFDLYIVSSIAFFIIAFIALNKSHILSVDKKPEN